MIEILSALLTPTIGIIAVYIAWQQYRIAKHKIKMELFEHRHRTILSLLEFYREVIKDGTTKFDNVFNFDNNTKDVEFFFSDECVKIFEEFKKKSFDLATYQDQLYPKDQELRIPPGDKRNLIAEKKEETLSWIMNEIKPLLTILKKETKIDF